MEKSYLSEGADLEQDGNGIEKVLLEMLFIFVAYFAFLQNLNENGGVENGKESKVESNQKKPKLSREEIQEFKIAFRMCMDDESKENLHKDKVEELFITLGYSLAPQNIQK